MIARIQNLWATEPVVIIGIVGSIIVFAIEQFAGKGVIGPDTGHNLINLVQALLPLLGSLVARSQVSSPATVARLSAPSA